MIRLTWILAALAIAAVTGHFGYLHLVAAPVDATAPTAERAELAWLERELALSPAQRVAVRALHEACWAQVATLRTQLAQERQAARTTGATAACVAAEDECKNCTVMFIRRMTTVLTPAQREKYLSLVAACLPPATPGQQGAPVEPSPRR